MFFDILQEGSVFLRRKIPGTSFVRLGMVWLCGSLLLCIRRRRRGGCGRPICRRRRRTIQRTATAVRYFSSCCNLSSGLCVPLRIMGVGIVQPRIIIIIVIVIVIDDEIFFLLLR